MSEGEHKHKEEGEQDVLLCIQCGKPIIMGEGPHPECRMTDWSKDDSDDESGDKSRKDKKNKTIDALKEQIKTLQNRMQTLEEMLVDSDTVFENRVGCFMELYLDKHIQTMVDCELQERGTRFYDDILRKIQRQDELIQQQDDDIRRQDYIIRKLSRQVNAQDDEIRRQDGVIRRQVDDISRLWERVVRIEHTIWKH